MIHLKYAPLATALATLAACSGGTSTTPVTATSLQSDLAAFTESFGEDIANDNFADLSTLPTEGTATYAGVIGIGRFDGGRDFDVSEAELASPIGIDIRLGSGEMTGSAAAFVVVETQERLDGTLTLNGTLNRVDPEAFQLQGNITGVLTDLEANIIDVRGDFAGDLFGADAAGLSADSDGNVTTRNANGDAIAEDTFTYDADIIAERTN